MRMVTLFFKKKLPVEIYTDVDILAGFFGRVLKSRNKHKGPTVSSECR